MEKRFGVLRLLCWIQIALGILVIAIFLSALAVHLPELLGALMNVRESPIPDSALTTTAIILGGILVGLAIIATAQVYQCLMQIEVNTRPVAIRTIAAVPQELRAG